MPANRDMILRVVLGYAVAAGVWILLAEAVLHRIWPAGDWAYHISIAIGAVFIAVTAAILYVVLRRMQRRLHESQERFRQTFERSAVGMAHATPDGRRLRVNQRYCDILGYSPEEMLARTYRDDTHPDDLAGEQALHARLIKGEIDSYEIEKRLFRRDRSIVWATLTISLVRDEAGRPDYIFTTVQNITKRKQAETALREHEQHLRAIIETEPECVKVVNREGRLAEMNPAGLAMLEADSLADACSCSLLEYIVPEYRAAFGALHKRVIGGERGSLEFEIVGRKGTRRWLETHAAPLRDSEGRVTSLLGVTRDITERKRAEAALRASENRIRSLFEQAADGIVMTTPDLAIIDANPAFATMLGYTGEELSHLAIPALVAAREIPRIAPEAARLERGVPHLGEWLMRRKDGSEFSAEVNARVLSNGAYLAIVRDLTARKQAEQALRDVAMHVQLAARAGNVGLWDWDLRTDKVYYSPEWKSQLGYGEDEISDPHWEWSSRLHPDDRERTLATTQAFLANPEGGFRCEFRLRHKDGSYRWILSQGEVIRDEQGNPVRMLGSHIDLSERRRTEAALIEAEARLRAMADNSPLGITLKDLDGRYVFVNKRFATWQGVRPEDAIGKTPQELFAGRSPDAMQSQERDLLMTGQPTRRTECVKFGDGTEHWLEITKFLVPGPTTTIGSLAQDVTAQRQIEEQLRQAQRLEAVGQLTGGVAHDFNNLLTVVMGNLEILGTMVKGNSEGTRAAEMGMRAANRGAELTHRLLAFSRRQVLSPRVVDPGALVHDTARLLKRTLGETVRLTTAFPAHPGLVFIDPGQLENALINLALNSRDAMPEGGNLAIEVRDVSLTDTTRAGDADVAPGNYVVLTVRDTGTGMTPEVAARAFEPFFTTKEVGQGSGLGLSMVYGFVKQSGGYVAIDTAPGEGTAIHLYLPRAPADAVVDTAKEAGEPTLGQGERILLVEDDARVREITAGMLRGLGYAVVSAGTALDALGRLGGADRFDLLLTDVVLPQGMSGLELAEAAHRNQPEMRILFMSGYAKAAAASERIEAVGGSLMMKPFSRVALSRAVSETLRAAPHVAGTDAPAEAGLPH